ncbi:MAG TPA: hypothetical protein VMT54_03915 [Candidatus Cybelea sp.]|nr:hypothetical protein [Candidatus Cybelea sp.]
MTVWQTIAGERLMLYSPVGLRLVDDFTGRAPFGTIRTHLDQRRANLTWLPTDIAAVRTPSDVITYPGLGRSAHPLQPPVRYRVRLEAEFYRPDYLLNQDAIEFDVHPYDDDNPPVVIVGVPQDVFLIPSTNYPYPGHVRVLRGSVVDNAADPVANVEVTEGVGEKVLTDDRGQFSLPLRWPPFNAALQIDALDHRTGATGQINVNLPADLSTGHIIPIN